jgi:hypothetical protein
MDGAQHVQGYVGYGEIPNKQQPEPVYGPSRVSPWTERWEGPFSSIYALAASFFQNPTTNPQPLNNNLDMARWGRETMEPRNYANSAYYELWFRSVVRWLQRSGRATTAELTGKRKFRPAIIDVDSLNRAKAIEHNAKTEAVPGFGFRTGVVRKGGATTPVVLYPVYSSTDYPNENDPNVIPKFKVGDRIRAVLQHGSGHTREYAIYRGKLGEVVAYYGLAKEKKEGEGPAEHVVFQPYYQKPFPDITCRGLQDFLVPLYSVRFLAKDIFGADYVERIRGIKQSESVVYLDMWEPYMEPA